VQEFRLALAGGVVPGHWQTVPGFAAFREKQVKNYEVVCLG